MSAGQQQDVQRVQAADDVGAGELAAEQEERDPGADDRDALDHAVDDAEAVAGEQVIGERVAGEAPAIARMNSDEADDPVDLARLAERTGEEDAQHVQAIEATNSSAAQWWTWRMNRPPRMSKEMSSDELYATDISTPFSGV